MSDLKDIAGKHIERADNLQSSSLKYIVGFTLIVLFCWYFAETVFTNTKYESIRYNKLEQRVDSFKLYNGKLTQQQQSDYDFLKKKRNVQDSTTSEAYKAVEENIPSGFKFLLRQATQKPYGLLLTSVTVLIFLFYLYRLRKDYLLKLCIAVRIIKSGDGINEIYDYNVRLPFWALPIPNSSINGVEKKDIVIIGGLNTKNTLHYCYIISFLLGLLFIQYRVYYISLVTNSFLLNWILILQSLILFTCILTFLLWVLPSSLRDTYNHEIYTNPNSRRNFITSSSILLMGIGVGLFSHAISTSIIHKILKPRFVKKEKLKKLSNCRKIELTALDEIKKKDFEKSAKILFAEISKPKSLDQIPHYIRLFHLLILLCLKNSNIHKNYFSKTVEIAKRSGIQQLKEMSATWSNLTIKKMQRLKQKRYWDNQEI